MYDNIVAENNQLEESSFSHCTPRKRYNEECNHRRGGLMFGELPMLAAWAGGFPPEEGVEEIK